MKKVIALSVALLLAAFSTFAGVRTETDTPTTQASSRVTNSETPLAATATTPTAGALTVIEFGQPPGTISRTTTGPPAQRVARVPVVHNTNIQPDVALSARTPEVPGRTEAGATNSGFTFNSNHATGTRIPMTTNRLDAEDHFLEAGATNPSVVSWTLI